MRRLALLAMLVPSIALAQNAPDEPKGRIIDPFARMPHPRDKLRLPDPRTAAEKAAADGVVTPDSPPPTPPPAPPPEPPPVAAAAPAPATPPQIAQPAAAGTYPAFGRSKTPFGITTMRIKVKHDDSPPTPPRQGGTLQVGLGPGWIHLTSDYNSLTSPRGTAGLSLAYGAWASTNLAVQLRAAAVAIPYTDGVLTQGYLGPTLQIWPTETWWFGLGLGAAILDVDLDNGQGGRAWGPAADVRVGHTLFQRSGHALDVSLELSPGVFELEDDFGNDDVSLIGTSIGLLVGYQML